MAHTKHRCTKTYFGQSITSTVTTHPDIVKNWIDSVYAGETNSVPRHVGFEFEINYAAIRIGTLQFYVGNQCLIFQLRRTLECPPSLEQFLGDHSNTFVGSHIASKIDLLRAQCPFTGVVPFLGERKQGLLASIALGAVETVLIQPSIYSSAQVDYASLDAFLNLHIAQLLSHLN